MKPLTLCIATAFTLGIAPAAPLAGQDANLNVFLYEKSYAGVGTPDNIGAPSYYARVAEPDLLSEAQLAVHLPLARGLTQQELREGDGRGFNLFLTPQFRLRGLAVESGPVRSISFMPKFTLQWLWARGGDGFSSPGHRQIFGAQLVLGHHSNGGSTCVFVDESFDADGQCVSSLAPVPPASQRVTRVNGGNFSTNYIEVGGGYRVGSTSDTPGGDHWSWFAEGAVSYQRHHNLIGFPLPGGPAEGFDDLYGVDRLRVDASAFVHLAEILGPKLDWLGLRGGVRFDAFQPEEARFAGSKNHTLQSELFFQFIDGVGASLPGGLRSLGLGVRFSRGMDYYNTQFVRDISFWQFVVMVDPWSPRLN